MTRFEKDLRNALEGDWLEVLTRRAAEIKKLTAEGKACKNKFRMTCIAQDLARLQREYDEISSYF